MREWLARDKLERTAVMCLFWDKSCRLSTGVPGFDPYIRQICHCVMGGLVSLASLEHGG